MVNLEEWIWDCYPIQIRHGCLKPTIRMMYTDVYRGSITNNTKGLVEHGCTSSRGMGGYPFFTPSWKLLRRLSCVDTDRPNINLDFLKMRCPNYLQAMETIWKPYGNHMETIWNHVLFIAQQGPTYQPPVLSSSHFTKPGLTEVGLMLLWLIRVPLVWSLVWDWKILWDVDGERRQDGVSDQQHFMQMDWGCDSVFSVLGDGHN